MNLPPFVYAKSFWEAVSLAVAGLLALLAFFGHVDADWAVPAATVSAWIYSLLRLFNIEPELQARALDAKLRRAEKLVEEAAIIRNDLLYSGTNRKPAKAGKK